MARHHGDPSLIADRRQPGVSNLPSLAAQRLERSRTNDQSCQCVATQPGGCSLESTREREKAPLCRAFSMRRRGLEPPLGYPGPGPQPRNPGVRCVQMARTRPFRPRRWTIWTHRMIRMLPRMLPRPRPSLGTGPIVPCDRSTMLASAGEATAEHRLHETTGARLSRHSGRAPFACLLRRQCRSWARARPFRGPPPDRLAKRAARRGRSAYCSDSSDSSLSIAVGEPAAARVLRWRRTRRSPWH
jgi:hypothetical protein